MKNDFYGDKNWSFLGDISSELGNWFGIIYSKTWK